MGSADASTASDNQWQQLPSKLPQGRDITGQTALSCLEAIVEGLNIVVQHKEPK